MSLTEILLDPAINYINCEWSTSPKTSKRLYARTANLLLAPVALITHAIDIILGLGVTLGVICTFGRNDDLNYKAGNLLDHSTRIFTTPYMQLLKAIDPKQKSYEKRDQDNINCDAGLLTEKVEFIITYALKTVESKKKFKRNVVSRITFTLAAIASLITRVIDGIIGALATILSLITLGHFHKINRIAYQGLQAPGVIVSLYVCTLGILNPQALN